MPNFLERYNFLVEKFERNEPQIAFEDINDDGISEYISLYERAIDHCQVNIGDPTLNLYDQWNIWSSKNVGASNPFFGDFDHDGLKEIYVFSQRDDSLFLNVNEYFDSAGVHINKGFISLQGKEKGKDDVNAWPCGLFDQNGDGKDELLFSITTGYGLWPRLVFTFDVTNKNVKSSPYTSISLNNAEMKDVDDDGRPEIFGVSTASGNHHVATPYSDYSAWIMVYQDDLQLKFPPIGFEGFGNSLITKGINSKTFKGYVSILHANKATSKEVSRLIILSQDGKIVQERSYEHLGISSQCKIEVISYQGEERVFVFSNPVLILDHHLDLIETIEVPPLKKAVPAMLNPFVVDFNHDKENEVLVRLADDQTYAVYSQAMDLMGVFNVPTLDGEIPRISSYKTQTENKLLLKTHSQGHFITLIENPYSFLAYLLYPAIYLSFVFFILIIQKITTAQVKKQEQQKRRIQELQLRSIKGQLDPHFTFNALNAIGSMLQLEDRNVAYDYLSKFTRLLRQLIGDSDRIYRSLEEELEFVTAYLQLEKIRFEEKFDFTIHLDAMVTKKEMVPIMCIQIFAENAIRHGIMPLEKGGLVTIDIKREQDMLVILIQDNGIGRKKAGEDNPHHGRGLKMTKEFYEILNQQSNRPISYIINDLYDGEKSIGTKVEVRIPI